MAGAFGRRLFYWRVKVSLGPALRPPIPGHFKASFPKPFFRTARAFFIGRVIKRKAPEGDSPAIRHHPAGQIFRTLSAYGDKSPMPIPIQQAASNRRGADMLGQHLGRMLAATPRNAP